MELINKYRPAAWDEVVGHEAQVRGLEAAIKKGTAHTFLLTGPSGVGKTTLARLAARALGEHELVEVDAATYTGIDDMRSLTASCAYRPLGGGKRAVIIDEFHALSKAAVQSWLKALEEPQPWTYFFLCTTEPQRVIDTIRTRCYRVDLKPIKDRDLLELLNYVVKEEKLKLPKDVTALCAEEAGGSARQALSNLAMCAEVKTYEEAEQAVLHAATENAEAIELARALIQNQSWKTVQALLKKLGDTNPESVRHKVRGYVTAVILNAKDERSAGRGLEVLDAFSTPFNSADGVSPLVLACGKAVLS